MRCANEVMRAQARVLIRVLRGYGFEQPGDSRAARLWQAVEAYGESKPRSLLLRLLSVKFISAARHTDFNGRPVSPAKCGALWALHAFCCEAPEYRFQMPSYWAAAALAVRYPACDVKRIHAEIYERLEDAFDEEMFPKEVT